MLLGMMPQADLEENKTIGLLQDYGAFGKVFLSPRTW